MASIEPLGTSKLMGQDKWLGGVASPCGKYIYGVPGHAKTVLRIVVASGEVVCLPLYIHCFAFSLSFLSSPHFLSSQPIDFFFFQNDVLS